MNRTIADRCEDDDEVRGWIAEAGDPRVYSRPEHIERVRDLILQRVASSPPARPGRRWVVLARLAVAAAGVLVVGAIVAILPLARPGNAWAQVARAVQEKPWIHIVGKGPGDIGSESWLSPRFAIVAHKYDRGPDYRGAEYFDLKTGIKTQYVAAENTIHRVREGGALREHASRSLQVLRQFLSTEANPITPDPQTEIVAQTSRDVTEDGRTWRQLEITIRWKEGRRSVVKNVIRVDRATGLPRTWDLVADEGVVHQTLDYPETGPGDILALGVPATARRVDRVPGDDLDRVLEGLKIGRNRFDDYCGFTWFEGVNPANVRRIWRKGRKWRVDDVQRRILTKAEASRFDVVPDGVPLGVDWDYWKLHEAELVFDPMAICDGKTIWFYRYKPNTIEVDQPYFAEVESVQKQAVGGGADDPFMPWPHLLPEHQSHPIIFVPTPDREFTIEPKPSDGPPGTVRISVRDTQFQDAKRPDLYQLWIDPERNHVAMRTETSVVDPDGPRTAKGSYAKIAYVDSQVLTDLDRSPSGFWYPTRVVRKTSNLPREQVTRFLLDFKAAIPDSLFEPER
jgi:hypothetical protein